MILEDAVQQYMYSLVCPVVFATHACARLLMEGVAVSKASVASKLALLLRLTRLILLTLTAEQHKDIDKGSTGNSTCTD